jgi:hypothetical protein
MEESNKLWEDIIEKKNKMCEIIGAKPETNACKVLSSALFSAKSTIGSFTGRYLYIQELSASLNRKNLLPNEKVDEFRKLGYEYMEIDKKRLWEE